MLYGVIMAGGSGTRFWPKSRTSRPKQLISIVGEKTMLQMAASRLLLALPPERIMVITHVRQAEESARQLAMHEGIRIIAEPEGRDTAACIGLSALLALREDPNAVTAVLPADHIIKPEKRFAAAVLEAANLANREHALITIGIKPNWPSTQYGYIKRGDKLGTSGDFPVYAVETFREKPNRDTAEKFVESGEYYWNSGTFVWRARDIMEEIKRNMFGLHSGLMEIDKSLGASEESDTIARIYPTLEKISIDYGIMERAHNVIVLEADYDWDDLGSWSAIARHYPADESGNTAIGRTFLLNSRDCIAVSEGDHLLAASGVDGLVIVHSPDATLICKREKVDEVKSLVEKMKKNGLNEYL